jgi:hypothetical protein
MTTKIAFSKIKKLVQAAYPEAVGCRRPVTIEVKAGAYHVSDYFDGGSRTYSRFVKLETGEVVRGDQIPRAARQVAGNPLAFPIGDVELARGFVVVEHDIFCGQDCGYRVVVHPDDFGGLLLKYAEVRALPAHRHDFSDGDVCSTCDQVRS